VAFRRALPNRIKRFRRWYFVPNSDLKVRLDALRKAQNTDGGWGYFPGKESWLEPTAYAAMALHGEPEADRAWQLLVSWQLPDGSWKPSERVKVSNWGTSLCVTLAVARNDWGAALQHGVSWLICNVCTFPNRIGT